MEMICLGNKGYDTNQKNGFGFILKMEQLTVMFDCGPFALPALKQIGMTPNDIDLIFISHDHADHCLGLPWFFNSLMMDEYYHEYSLTKKKVIFPSGRDSHIIKYIENHFGWMIENENIEINFDTSKINKLYEAEFNIFPINHSVENYGLEINCNDGKVVYIPDFEFSNSPAVSEVIKCANLAIFSIAGSSKYEKEAIEFSFSTSEQIAKIAKESGVKKIWGFHLFHEDDVKAVEDEMLRIFEGDFSLPILGEKVLI